MQRSNKLGLAAAAFASMMVASQAHAATNLITDGDFSSPNAGAYGSFASGTGGWTSSESVIEIGASGTYGLGCITGSCQNLEVNANTFDTVSQTVGGLVVGKTYTLSYDYGGRPGGGVQKLDVSFGGTLLTEDTGSLGVWTPDSFTFKATNTSEILTFASVDTSPLGGLPSYGNEITAVSLTAAVPEPASWAMMILGLGCIGFVLRRRNVQASALA